MLFLLLDKTIGKLLRVLQRMLIPSPILRFPTRISLFDEMHNLSVKSSAAYAALYFKNALFFKTRENLWQYCKKNIKESEGFMFEFGVHKGYSINFFSDLFPNFKIFGFDSFKGLEEDWGGYQIQMGTFDLNGKLPEVSKKVTLIDGWFEDTLPNFLKSFANQVTIVHLDADTYKPTIYVLNQIMRILGPGTIIIFDQFFGYTGYEEHEFKAWNEFTLANRFKYKVLGYSESAVAFQVI